MQAASPKGSVVHCSPSSFLVLLEVLHMSILSQCGLEQTLCLSFPRGTWQGRKERQDGFAAAFDFAAVVVLCFVSPQHQWTLGHSSTLCRLL